MPELSKLTIMPLDGKMANQGIEVMFNPREIHISKATPWKDHNVAGHDAPTIEFTSGEPYRMTFELFFDCYETYPETKIRDLTDKIERLTLVDGDIHRPPICLLTWGRGLSFKCVLESFTLRFTLFHEDGTPLRGIMNTTWKEYYEVELQGKTEPRHSADRTKRRVVKQGDTLSWIAGKEYDDPAKWRVIADANGIDDPVNLVPGTELIIPPIV